MSCYIIYHYNILDRERIKLLGPLSLPIVEKFGGELVIASSTADCLEGTSPYLHMVVYKFKSEEAAKSFYESEESRELSKLRNEITEGYAVLMPQIEREDQVRD